MKFQCPIFDFPVRADSGGSQMTKEEIYQRVLDCRLIADEVCTETLLVSNARERFELNWHAKKILDEIDFFLNCLRYMGVEVDDE